MSDDATKVGQINLPDNLDLSATVKLAELFSEKRGTALQVNASQVNRVGAQCLQILVSANKTWAADEHAFQIVEPSQALLECLANVGISRSDLNLDGVAPQ
ncbi:MAG: STAS domain-containing protein [Hyphomicrobiaceae bacterium]